jgi:hypothetical protein
MKTVITVVLALSSGFASAFEYFVNEEGKPLRWKEPQQLTWRVESHDPNDKLHEAAAKAFATWQKETFGVVQFTEAPCGDAHILVKRDAQWQYPFFIVGYTTPCIAEDTSVMQAARIEIRNEVDDDVLDGVLLHEIGHALGIAHATKFNAEMLIDLPTMFPSVGNWSSSLHVDDIKSVINLYDKTKLVCINTTLDTIEAKVKRVDGKWKIVCVDKGAKGQTEWQYGETMVHENDEIHAGFATEGVQTIFALRNGRRWYQEVEWRGPKKKPKLIPKK